MTLSGAMASSALPDTGLGVLVVSAPDSWLHMVEMLWVLVLTPSRCPVGGDVTVGGEGHVHGAAEQEQPRPLQGVGLGNHLPCV